MFGYSGWNAATYVAEEVRRPERTLPMAIATGTVLVTALYMGLNAIYIYAAPPEQMKGVIAVGSLAASNLFGGGIAGAFSALMALAIVSTVSAEVTVGPRVYYAMARNRAFFRSAGVVHPRWHTPVFAILSQGMCAMVMTVTPFRELILYIGIEPDSLHRAVGERVDCVPAAGSRDGSGSVVGSEVFCYPLIPASYILVGVSMMIFGVVSKPAATLTAFATVGAGALVYRFAVRERKVWMPFHVRCTFRHPNRVHPAGFRSL